MRAAVGNGNGSGMEHEAILEARDALLGAQAGEQGGHVRGRVLVDAMQAHQRIEDQQARSVMSERGGEARPVALEIEPQAGAQDEVEVEPEKPETAGGGDGLYAGAQVRGGPGEPHRAYSS